MRAIDDARAACGATREFYRGLYRLRAGISEKHLVQIRHVFQQPLGQHTSKRRDIKLHQIGQVAIENALQGGAEGRMISADGKHAEAAQEIQVAHAIAIEEILALSLLEPDVVTDCFEDPNQLLI